jgi:histidinol dehydrogenase
MNVMRHTDADFAARIERAAGGSSLLDPVVDERAKALVESVRSRGDAALSELTERFDGAQLRPEQFAVSAAELAAASLAADEPLRVAVREAHENIATFARKSARKGWQNKNSHGAAVGEKFDPFQRVGIYIPGGTAPLVSTALMTVTLAQVAGCPEIVVCTPPAKDGTVNPALLFAAQTAGATEIYKVGGAQAIAALAYGTTTIRPVQKVFGPGNAYVVAAKRQLFGQVAVDLLPGPSEVLVLADDSANPKFVAADMLAQAEHGSGHERVWLVTTSGKLLKAVEKELTRQLPKLSRRAFAEKILQQNGWLIHAEDLDQALAITNRFAPEHCEVMTAHARDVAERIKTAGAIFLGDYSPTVLGDYVAGPSHELPTGGAGRCFAGLTVDQFQRRTSVVEYGKGALKQALKAVQKFAELEGLDAHGRSATIRADK